jgi:hypothetical protein
MTTTAANARYGKLLMMPIGSYKPLLKWLLFFDPTFKISKQTVRIGFFSIFRKRLLVQYYYPKGLAPNTATQKKRILTISISRGKCNLYGYHELVLAS